VNTEAQIFLTCARKEIRDLAPIVRAAAGDKSKAVTKKPDGSLVTLTDTLVESRLVSAFTAALPEIPILGEEGAIDQSQVDGLSATEVYGPLLASPWQIIVDPIDGTRNFVEGSGPYCIAAALSRRTQEGGIWPVASVIALPTEMVLLWADGEHAFCEDLTSGKESQMQHVASSTGAISVNSRDRAWLASRGFVLQQPWVSSGSSIYDLVASARGRLQGSVVGSQRLWDLIAPLGVAMCVGLTLRDLESDREVREIRPSDLSQDVASRPWGLSRRMALVPRGTSVRALVAT
jgi:fructose-1,6-bisphosphatase/inositol monophosphatase family enzyme